MFSDEIMISDDDPQSILSISLSLLIILVYFPLECFKSFSRIFFYYFWIDFFLCF